MDEVLREGFIGRKTAVYLKGDRLVVGILLLVRDKYVAIETDKGDEIFQHSQVESIVIGYED